MLSWCCGVWEPPSFSCCPPSGGLSSQDRELKPCPTSPKAASHRSPALLPDWEFTPAYSKALSVQHPCKGIVAVRCPQKSTTSVHCTWKGMLSVQCSQKGVLSVNCPQKTMLSSYRSTIEDHARCQSVLLCYLKFLPQATTVILGKHFLDSTPQAPTDLTHWEWNTQPCRANFSFNPLYQSLLPLTPSNLPSTVLLFLG